MYQGKPTGRNPTELLPQPTDLLCLAAGPQLWQTMQTQAHFQLLLPPGKMCSIDYSGLLQAFQVFILDELIARGFCQIQVCASLSIIRAWSKQSITVRETQVGKRLFSTQSTGAGWWKITGSNISRTLRTHACYQLLFVVCS